MTTSKEEYLAYLKKRVEVETKRREERLMEVENDYTGAIHALYREAVEAGIIQDGEPAPWFHREFWVEVA
jgi:hypothetical protein